ncbi:ANTAR domain-containing protein [Streptomyces sp. NPDC055189]
MTERALPAQLAEDSEAAPTASPGSPAENLRALLPVEAPRTGARPGTPTSADSAYGADTPDTSNTSDIDDEQNPHARAEQAPDDELLQLRRAMRTRPVIDMARGVLMASFGLNAEDAWSVLVSVSQNTNTKLHAVADDLVSAVTGGEIPPPFRRQLAATVARLQTPPAPSGADEG